MAYGPNGEYETVKDYLDANPSAKALYTKAAEEGSKKAQEYSEQAKVKYQSLVQPKYGTNCSSVTSLTAVQPKYGTNCSPVNSLTAVQPKYGTSCSTVYSQPAYGVQVVQPKYGTSCVQVQPAYGVQVVQPKYGTSCVQVQPAYGVQVVQPKYGTSCTFTDLSITYAQVEENITKLKKAVSTLRSTWDGETKANLNTINNSWAGEDCSAYTQKLSKMDSKVQNTISALDLLRSTYEQAINQVKESQQTSLTSISKLEG